MNLRFGLWISLDVACGVDLPYYYYQTCLGEPFDSPARYPVGRRWLHLVEDLRGMRMYSAEGAWSWPRWLASVVRLSAGPFFAWDDPGPGLYVLRDTARDLLRLPRRRGGGDPGGETEQPL